MGNGRQESGGLGAGGSSERPPLSHTTFDRPSRFVDEEGSSPKHSLDLIGDFSTSENFGVEGRVWIELKVFSEARFAQEVAKAKAELQIALARERKHDKTLGAVLLLAAKAAKDSRTSWGPPTLLATLNKFGSNEWKDLTGASRRSASRSCASCRMS